MGQFKKGKSGNPRGRPTGSRGHLAKWRESLAVGVPKVIEVVSEKALGGDMKAAKLLLDKAMPNARGSDAAAYVSLNDDASLDERAAEINRLTLAGHMNPDTGTQLLKNLEAEARIKVVADLDPQVKQIKKVLKQLEKVAPHLLPGLK